MILAALLLAAAAPRWWFVDGQRNPAMLAAIRRGADRDASFAGRYVQSFVPCGVACGSYWFVDRRTGAVLAAPDESRDGESVETIVTRIDSRVVRVVYGARDGIGACTARQYRLVGVRFLPMGGRMPSPCDGGRR